MEDPGLTGVDRMETLFELVAIEVLLIGVFVLIVVMFILQLVQGVRLSRLRLRYQSLLGEQGPSGQPLEEVLQHHLGNVSQALERVAALEGEAKRLRRKTQICVRRPGVVRFNAFPDTGGEMSFSLALLDHDMSGAVITSMYGRNESFVYAKPVERGQSTFHMTQEEKEAIEKARKVE